MPQSVYLSILWADSGPREGPAASSPRISFAVSRKGWESQASVSRGLSSWSEGLRVLGMKGGAYKAWKSHIITSTTTFFCSKQGKGVAAQTPLHLLLQEARNSCGLMLPPPPPPSLGTGLRESFFPFWPACLIHCGFPSWGWVSRAKATGSTPCS